MVRFSSLLIGAAVISLSTAAAYDDPVGNEIQARMQEEAQRQIIDMAATPPWPEDEYYEDEDDYAYDDAPAYSYEEWQAWSDERAQQDAARQAELLNDPKYQAFLNGEWLHRTPRAGETDQTCSALFLRKGVGVMVVALGGDKDAALLVFLGPDIPAPAKLEKMRVDLRQNGEAPANVEVFNAALPWAADLGAIVFAVPTAEAALAGMTDTLAFNISGDGKRLAEIEWTGGVAARDKLSTCITGRS